MAHAASAVLRLAFHDLASMQPDNRIPCFFMFSVTKMMAYEKVHGKLSVTSSSPRISTEMNKQDSSLAAMKEKASFFPAVSFFHRNSIKILFS